MPSAREIRARQNRQRERIAAAQAERRRVQRRRQKFGVTVVVIVLVLGIAVGLAGGFSSGGGKVAVSPSTVPASTLPATTIPALASAKGKPCVGLKDPIPKGSPGFLVGPGPAPTKLTTQDLKVGPGAVVPKNAKVTVNYTGVACSTGKIFESSFGSGQPFDADLNGGVIAGWEQGIPGMHIGGVRLLGIPSTLAYGPAGSPPKIAPDEALYFLVEAVKLP